MPKTSQHPDRSKIAENARRIFIMLGFSQLFVALIEQQSSCRRVPSQRFAYSRDTRFALAGFAFADVLYRSGKSLFPLWNHREKCQ
jgi:hypothetical protein